MSRGHKDIILPQVVHLALEMDSTVDIVYDHNTNPTYNYDKVDKRIGHVKGDDLMNYLYTSSFNEMPETYKDYKYRKERGYDEPFNFKMPKQCED